MDKTDIVLASASPRRRELLSVLIGDFRVAPSTFDEERVPPELAPAEHVAYSARMKMLDAACACPKSIVIGADTVVVVDGAILGKPSDESDAARMLRALSGKTHQVYTGIAAARDGVETSGFECTDVTFCVLDEDTISRYVATGEPMDKAGAYAIQGKGGVFVTRVDGCYFNVVGLPLHRLSLILSEFGIRIP